MSGPESAARLRTGTASAAPAVQARTASAEMIQRLPRLTAGNSPRAIALRITLAVTFSVAASESTVYAGGSAGVG